MTPLPLEAVKRALAGGGAVDGEAGRAAARALGLPPARLRALVAFHPDLARPDPALRVCAGTSCFLRGAARLAAALPEARAAHCLGHCDRSPCVATASGSVRVACRPETVRVALAADEVPERRSIRCRAREPIVTRHLDGRGDASLDDARARGIYDALEHALAAPRERVLDVVERSGEVGRGGAGFPTGAKWRAAAAQRASSRVVVANGDEGDPGAFVDRLLLEEDPHGVLEGLALCAYAVGAEEGIVFVRAEYPRAVLRVQRAIAEAEAAGLLGARIRGSDFSLSVRVATGHGSYVGGEETSLLETVEGRVGEVRIRPPYPVERGLAGRPTVVNNVETLVAVPWIVARGADAHRRLGTAASPGTKAICLSAGFGSPGVVEIELGRSLRAVIDEDAGGGDLEAVLLGGPMGSLLFPEQWDVPVCYDALSARGIRLGHGGLVAIPRGVDWNGTLRHALAFFARESCGRCVPCREGSRRARDLVEEGCADAATLDGVLEVVERASLCAFGRGAPGPLRALLARLGSAVLERRS